MDLAGSQDLGSQLLQLQLLLLLLLQVLLRLLWLLLWLLLLLAGLLLLRLLLNKFILLSCLGSRAGVICSTSPPGGNQVDGLPPAASLFN